MKKYLTLIAILIATSCSHKLEITNFHENRIIPSAPLAKNNKIIGISSENQSFENQQYMKAIVTALRNSNTFDQVIYPYSASSSKNVDYVVNVSVSPNYSGKTSNFFVNWPGFLVFTPAILGYGYNAKINTDLSVSNSKTKKAQNSTISNNYNFRHAEMDRTWTEIGWLEVSIIPFIGGFFFTQYDPDATEEFLVKVSENYGSGVANGIIEAIRAVE